MNPDIVLADEPTGNLDTGSDGDIMSLFEELWKQGRTLIVITHDQALAKRAGLVVEIRLSPNLGAVPAGPRRTARHDRAGYGGGCLRPP